MLRPLIIHCELHHSDLSVWLLFDLNQLCTDVIYHYYNLIGRPVWKAQMDLQFTVKIQSHVSAKELWLSAVTILVRIIGRALITSLLPLCMKLSFLLFASSEKNIQKIFFPSFCHLWINAWAISNPPHKIDKGVGNCWERHHNVTYLDEPMQWNLCIVDTVAIFRSICISRWKKKMSLIGRFILDPEYREFAKRLKERPSTVVHPKKWKGAS